MIDNDGELVSFEKQDRGKLGKSEATGAERQSSRVVVCYGCSWSLCKFERYEQDTILYGHLTLQRYVMYNLKTR